MQHSQKFNLPDGETPGVIVSVVISQSGQLFLAHPQDMPMIGLISILAGGIQAATSAVQRQIEAEESRIVKPVLSSVPRNIREN